MLSVLWRDSDYAPPTAVMHQQGPRASIVILTFNQLEYTRLCVASVLRHTPRPFELIFVDNASSDATVEFLRTVPNSKLVANSENLGFAGGNNQGLALATGEVAVLLNNDAIVTPGWLDGIVGALERNPHVGFVGPRSNYVAGPQLLPEVPYQSVDGLDAFAQQRARAHAGEGTPTAFIVGFCLALRREIVQRIGGLDTRFGNGNFEDNDYCLRAVRSGWLGWIADDVFVHHYGHRSFIGAGIDWSASMKKNGRLFAEKWGLSVLANGMPDLSRAPDLLKPASDPARDYFALPETVAYTNVTAALAAYYEGLQRLQSGDAPGAVSSLLLAANAAPQVADFFNALGAAYFESGQVDKAIQALCRAAELAPGDASIRANLEEARATLKPAA
jgi:GT2 family glycosyltransferase